MKILSIICLFTIVSCAGHRQPSSLGGHPVAYDSMALGNVKASAIKRSEKQGVCFDISLTMTNVKEDQILPSNWTVAWVDKNDQYHLLPMNQRDPASTPQGGNVVVPYGQYNEWKNHFSTCVSQAQLNEVKSLVMTPKELPYSKKDGLKLNWN